MKSAVFETEPGPDEKFDFNAKPHTYYLEAEGTGAIPVNDVVVHGFEALEDKLGPMILQLHQQIDVEEGRAPKDDEMADENAYQPAANDNPYSAATAWNGSGQSPNGAQPSASSPWAAVPAPNYGGMNGGASSPWGSGPPEPAANTSQW
ncbi:hypothetical protein QFC22_003777 [Naganishia vaughanmartiniae]|uniref:Uncharacterized protein n=1 Tax=Naganishia vaughanmartiniae TaxID=1424756 RepID=A0ACC2X5I9_9TREE|nr:hypothetical protein QFC22_003777 [Naganishia vaughanmartiniae]